MALTTTTLAAAVAANDVQVVLTSATGVAAGSLLLVGSSEYMKVNQNYVAGNTTVPVRRGVQGTKAIAHVASENVNIGTGEDFSLPAPQLGGALPIAGRAREIRNYAASGAITLPTPGNDMVAILIGTSALAMTVAVPTKDMDGSILYVIGNAKSQSTVATATTVGYGNAGASYDTFTFQNAGNCTLSLIACNGFWSILNTPITGTSTALSVAIA